MLLQSMRKGPKLTKSNVKSVEGQDHLGIRSVGIAMAEQLQSGITSITPRARYWAFFAWVLHDFIQHVPKEKTMDHFKTYLKRQEWFYILANIAEAEERGVSTHQLIGVSKGMESWRKGSELFDVEYRYIQNSLGGYGTYRNVMKVLGVTIVGDEEAGVQIDRLTDPTGRALAEAFEQTICETTYYQQYRLTDTPVPREVIVEYGKAAALDRLKDLQAHDRPLLINIFMPSEPKTVGQAYRRKSMAYYMHIIQHAKGERLTFTMLQDVMFDELFDGRLVVPNKIHPVAIGWEIYQARQLFTYSLETMWCYLLEKMSRKIVTTSELITSVLGELSDAGCPLDDQVNDLFQHIPLTVDGRKDAFLNMKANERNCVDHIWQPLLILLHVFERLHNRADFNEFHQELLKLGGREGISFFTWNQFVESYETKTIAAFISYILRYFILEQHQNVALNKILTTGNETYHFVENNGKLHFIHDDHPGFNAFRVNQGLLILADLGLIEGVSGVYHVTPMGQVKLNEEN